MFKILILCFLFLGSCQKRDSSPLQGDSMAVIVQCPKHDHKRSVFGTSEDDVALRKADSKRHRSHLSGTWVFQGEGQFGTRSAV